MTTPDVPPAALTEGERDMLGERLMLTMTCNHGSDYFGTGAVCETCFANVQRIGRITETLLAARDQQWRERVEEVEQERDALRDLHHIGIELDNHHNAATCPYCRPQRDDWLARAEAAEERLRAVAALAELGVREQWPPDEWRAGLRAVLGQTAGGEGE